MSEPNSHITNFFLEHLLALEMKITMVMFQSAYLGLAILEISKIVIYEIWYDNVKPN